MDHPTPPPKLNPFTATNPFAFPEIDGVSISDTIMTLPDKTTIDLTKFPALVFVEAREELITSADDRHLREVALGGADTTARTQIVYTLSVEKAPAAVTAATAPYLAP